MAPPCHTGHAILQAEKRDQVRSCCHAAQTHIRHLGERAESRLCFSGHFLQLTSGKTQKVKLIVGGWVQGHPGTGHPWISRAGCEVEVQVSPTVSGQGRRTTESEQRSPDPNTGSAVRGNHLAPSSCLHCVCTCVFNAVCFYLKMCFFKLEASF